MLQATERNGIENDPRPPDAGRVVPVSTNAVFCELQRTWTRPDAAEFGALYGAYAPNYHAVMESFQKAQEASSRRRSKGVTQAMKIQRWNRRTGSGLQAAPRSFLYGYARPTRLRSASRIRQLVSCRSGRSLIREEGILEYSSYRFAFFCICCSRTTFRILLTAYAVTAATRIGRTMERDRPEGGQFLPFLQQSGLSGVCPHHIISDNPVQKFSAVDTFRRENRFRRNHETSFLPPHPGKRRFLSETCTPYGFGTPISGYR